MSGLIFEDFASNVLFSYCNSRIMKFSANGMFLMSWGEQSFDVGGKWNGYNQQYILACMLTNSRCYDIWMTVSVGGFPPPGSFSLPHGLTLLPDLGQLCVADRLNGRIQCFDYEGRFIIQIHHADFNGVIYGLSYSQSDGL